LKVAFLHSVFTEPKYRKQGYAKMIVESAIKFCNSNGIKRLLLNTSEEAKSLYKSLGFEYSKTSMSLFLGD
jgi:GNAT superfamily N-acetyltransferase